MQLWLEQESGTQWIPRTGTIQNHWYSIAAFACSIHFGGAQTIFKMWLFFPPICILVKNLQGKHNLIFCSCIFLSLSSGSSGSEKVIFRAVIPSKFTFFSYLNKWGIFFFVVFLEERCGCTVLFISSVNSSLGPVRCPICVDVTPRPNYEFMDKIKMNWDKNVSSLDWFCAYFFPLAAVFNKEVYIALQVIFRNIDFIIELMLQVSITVTFGFQCLINWSPRPLEVFFFLNQYFPFLAISILN